MALRRVSPGPPPLSHLLSAEDLTQELDFQILPLPESPPSFTGWFLADGLDDPDGPGPWCHQVRHERWRR